VIDNNFTYIDPIVTEAIEVEGHIVCFLPPYLPDFNLLELSFSVVKV
jgi:transposase